MSLKIIQITPAYKPAYIYGGPTMSVAKLCESIVQSQGDVEVLTTTANGQTELNVVQGKQVIVDDVPVTYFKRITKDHTHFSPSLLLALRKKIIEQRARFKHPKPQPTIQNPQLIIHIHSWWNLVTIFSCLIAKFYNIPVMLSPRGMLTNYTKSNRNSVFKTILHRLIGKSLLKYVHIIASTEREKQDVLEIIKPRSITILPNLVNLPNIPMKANQKNEISFRLLFLSRIEEKKGLHLLFDALSVLTIPWTISIAGTGEEIYLKNLKFSAKNLMIDSRVNWLGQVNNNDKFELIKKHDLLVLTSYNENFANVIIESLHVGTPVLISKEVGLSKYIEDNDLGFLTSLDSKQIALDLYGAYMNFHKRQRIRAQAPTIISQDFNEAILTQKYLTLYQQILNKS